MPSFCSNPQMLGDKALHTLDVIYAIRSYPTSTAVNQRLESFFVLPEGPNRGHAASKFTFY